MQRLYRFIALILATTLAGPALGAPGARATAHAGQAAGDYAIAVRQKILRNWTAPASVEPGQRCRVVITQSPGGTVVSSQFGADCQFDIVGRESIERAVRKAQPLPYKGYEAVFQRTMSVDFAVL